jgi:hypothetical protein
MNLGHGVGILAIGVLAGCGSSSNGAGDFAEPGLVGGGSSNGASSGSASTGAGNVAQPPENAGSGAPALPPETKVEGNYQSPVSTGNFVWIANPTSGRVAYINAQTFSVQTVQAGDGPTYLAAVPDPADDVAVVENVVSQDVTLLRNHAGTLTTTRFPSTANANAWAVSASGRWALAWTDATRVANADPTQGFQDVAVIDITGVRPTTILAVGYRPVEFAFSRDDSRAYGVTQDGITSIDLVDGSQATVTQNYPLITAVADAGMSVQSGASDAGEETEGGGPDVDTGAAVTAVNASAATSAGAGAPDVSFTPDGAYAIARVEGLPTLEIVALANGMSTAVTLPGVPTDLTVSPEGDFAVAVLRDTSTVAILPLPGIATAPTSFSLVSLPGQTIGRAIVPNGGKSVLLFTTAAPVDALVVLTPKPSPTFRVVTLRAPVLAVFPTADAQNAVVLHNFIPEGGSTSEGAFSLVPIGASTLPAKIVSLPAVPMAVALAPTSDRALVSMRDDTRSIYGADLAMLPSFDVTSYTLASPPIAVGITTGSAPGAAGAPGDAGDAGGTGDGGAGPAPRGYIAQDYAEGRITFVDLQDGSPRTISGFELGASIVGGGN